MKCKITSGNEGLLINSVIVLTYRVKCYGFSGKICHVVDGHFILRRSRNPKGFSIVVDEALIKFKF